MASSIFVGLTWHAGRVSRQSPKAGNGQSDAAQLRFNRKNAAKQTQVKKRQALVSATRIFSGVDGAPRIVAVIPLCEDVNSRTASAALAQSLDTDAEAYPELGVWKLKCVDNIPQWVLPPY